MISKDTPKQEGIAAVGEAKADSSLPESKATSSTIAMNPIQPAPDAREKGPQGRYIKVTKLKYDCLHRFL